MEPMEVGVDGFQADAGKRGRLCCGFCCDTKRAVIISDIIIIFGLMLTLALDSFAMVGAEVLEEVNLNDDRFNTAGMTQDQLNIMKSVMVKDESLIERDTILTMISIIALGISLVGAFQYRWKLVVPVVPFLILHGFIPLFNPLAILFFGAWCYPHIIFILEVRDGIMTKENYPNEEASCCCMRTNRTAFSSPPGDDLHLQQSVNQANTSVSPDNDMI
eukprot:CAMPEP_0178905480 /NCGR_PEP_ID=MMETSP0786-20121207/6298_1 /TAXON_ID=186022 /ORGANISM="Thalassionema frauenfeldii, Strain CCMP 1798" /LENGTH=217 /DNA_ID=CAMNT_0020577091 /DNA_START=194 /DNA_END=847 /DNA_ORIENTATION=+